MQACNSPEVGSSGQVRQSHHWTMKGCERHQVCQSGMIAAEVNTGGKVRIDLCTRKSLQQVNQVAGQLQLHQQQQVACLMQLLFAGIVVGTPEGKPFGYLH